MSVIIEQKKLQFEVRVTDFNRTKSAVNERRMTEDAGIIIKDTLMLLLLINMKCKVAFKQVNKVFAVDATKSLFVCVRVCLSLCYLCGNGNTEMKLRHLTLYQFLTSSIFTLFTTFLPPPLLRCITAGTNA